MNTFDAIINELERINCQRTEGLQVMLSKTAMRHLTISDWSLLSSHGISTCCVYHTDPGFLFCITEPRSKANSNLVN